MSATIATEDILVIETPERVPLHFALASIGNRFLACAIDHAMQAATIALMAIALTVVATNAGQALVKAARYSGRWPTDNLLRSCGEEPIAQLRHDAGAVLFDWIDISFFQHS